jgi:hypothetical protein
VCANIVSTADAQHLRALERLLNANIEAYLNGFSHDGPSAASFRPESATTSIPSDAAGIEAYCSIATIAEHITGLIGGPKKSARGPRGSSLKTPLCR